MSSLNHLQANELTSELVSGAAVKLKVLSHEIRGGLVNIIGNKGLDRWDFFEVPYRSEPSGCKCLQHLDAIMRLLLLLFLFLKHLIKLIDSQDGDISVELLDRVVEDSTSRLIDLVGFPAAFVRAFDAILVVFLHLLLDVQDVCFSFFEDFVPRWGLLGLLHFCAEDAS